MSWLISVTNTPINISTYVQALPNPGQGTPEGDQFQRAVDYISREMKALAIRNQNAVIYVDASGNASALCASVFLGIKCVSEATDLPPETPPDRVSPP